MSHYSVQDIKNDPNYVPIMDESGNLLVDEDESFILASRSVGSSTGYPHQKFRTWLKPAPKYIKR